MRRSFGGSSRGMGGGSGSSGGGIQLLRTVQRAVRAGGVGGGAQEPFSHSTSRGGRQSSFNNKSTTTTTTTSSTNNNNLTISSNSPAINRPLSATSSPTTNWPNCSSPTYTDEPDWEYIDGIEDDRPNAFFDDFVFGSVPSTDEVQHAVFSLQGVLEPVSSAYCIKDLSGHNLDDEISSQGSSPTGFARRGSSSGSKLDWMEPTLQLYNSNMLLPYGSNRVYDAFHMLQHEPSVQRMVVSLSSDRTVWDAVLNNEAVRELRESLTQAGESCLEDTDNASEASEASESGDLVSWFITNLKVKIMELINNLSKTVNELFHQQGGSDNKAAEVNGSDTFEEKLRASFMLSIVVLLIVMLNRADKA